MKMLIGKKNSMTQIFIDGVVVPVTVVDAGPCVVTQVKDKGGAVQLGWGRAKKLSKPQLGHLQGLGNFRVLREFRLKEESTLKRGDTLDCAQFSIGDKVNITAVSKGKGFQGVVKRHHFHGSPRTHGHKDQLRMPGASSAGGNQHVLLGKKMPGRMGNSQVTVKNLTVVGKEENKLLLKGAVPGARGAVVIIKG